MADSKSMVVAVSSPPGSGSTSVAKEIAKRLGLRLLVLGYAQKAFVDEKKESVAALESWKTNVGKSESTHTSRDKMQIDEAKKGGVVICGKLSVYFLKGLSDFRIWLDVPLEERARRSAERDGIPLEDAKKAIKEREDIERKEWKKMYGFDYFEQKDMADFVIDSSGMTLEETVEKIMDFIRSGRASR